MIIESHAHYTNNAYKNTFQYLTYREGQFAVSGGDFLKLLGEMEQLGIRYFVEPGVNLQSNREILELAQAYPGRFFPAIGLHPTRCIFEEWKARKQVAEMAKTPGVVAVGETGLDYHYERKQQHRLKQHFWFRYQLRLAWKLQKPLILHIRQADRDALRILRRHRASRLGGVVHCFNGSWEMAKAYLDLGFHIGIGGALMQPEERSGAFREAVKQIPLDRILLETDAPYVHPYCEPVQRGKDRRRIRNSSCVLQAVAREIAMLKGIAPEEVERVTAENTIRVFHLDIPVEPV